MILQFVKYGNLLRKVQPLGMRERIETAVLIGNHIDVTLPFELLA